MRTKLFLESTQNQLCFDIESYHRINVDKSMLNQRGYQVNRRRDVISENINVESMLNVDWVFVYNSIQRHLSKYFRWVTKKLCFVKNI